MSLTRAQTKRRTDYPQVSSRPVRLHLRRRRRPLALRRFGARVLADAFPAVDAGVAGAGAVPLVVAPGLAGVRVRGLAHRGVADEHAAVVSCCCSC
jgi:hypothetical protein